MDASEYLAKHGRAHVRGPAPRQSGAAGGKVMLFGVLAVAIVAGVWLVVRSNPHAELQTARSLVELAEERYAEAVKHSNATGYLRNLAAYRVLDETYSAVPDEDSEKIKAVERDILNVDPNAIGLSPAGVKAVEKLQRKWDEFVVEQNHASALAETEAAKQALDDARARLERAQAALSGGSP